MNDTLKGMAKVSWTNPENGQRSEYVLTEGATVTIGRSKENEICVPEQHVSRQHSVITYQYGMFMISDLGSANGTFVNDQQLTDPFPLAHGDVIRLFVPILEFSAVVTPEEEDKAIKTGTFITGPNLNTRPRLMITAGQQEGTEIPLYTDAVTLGRAVANASWEIKLEDRAVSRPHARIEKQGAGWIVTDLGSANGTVLNGQPVTVPVELKDGYVITMGQTTILFRFGG